MSDNNNNTQKGTNVQVAVRCRPLNQEERKGNQPTVVTVDSENRMIKVNYGPTAKKIVKTFTYDRVFGMYSTQEEVFESMVLPIVDETLAGFNCTIFAYGQTGTGKTHTMEGDIYCPENAGIVPRSVKAILEKLESTGSEFTIRVSFLELYNEELQDLLASDITSGSEEKGRLRLCEDAKKGVVCQNLEEITVLSVNDIFEILQRGIRQRQTAATLCNKNSSRSHSIFTMKIMIKETNVEGEEIVRHGQLNLVDLAGSECVGRSGAKNARAREAGSINQSLLTLGRVITALVDHHGHIPYRDSKLTRLLQESLGGKAKTCIIATLSPSQLAIEETLSTLDYAYRAKAIKNVPQVNQKMTKKVVLKEYCAEIESLRLQLQMTREKNGVYVDPIHYEQMENRLNSQEQQIQECESALRLRHEEIKSLREEVDIAQHDLDMTKIELQETSYKLEEAEENLIKSKNEIDYLQVEWKASEAVVKEQVTTEKGLSENINHLHQTVNKRQNDIIGLFAKIDRHSIKEKERIQDIQSYVHQLNEKQESIHSNIQEVLSNTTNQSTELCNDVSTLLVKGKDVCSILQNSIAAALVVLVNDTTTTKDTMIESCNDLKQRLGYTKNDVIQSLTFLQNELSQWLGDVESNMSTTQKILQEQQSKMNNTLQSLASDHEQIQSMNVEFLKKQQNQTNIIQENVEKLKVDVNETLRNYQIEQEEEINNYEILMKEQSENIQKTLNGLIGEMMTSNKNFLTKSKNNVNNVVTTVSSMNKSSLSNISNDITSMKENVLTSSTNISNLVTNTINTTKSSIQQNISQSQEIESIVDIIASTAGQKRNILDETLENVSGSINTSITSACNDVQSTADVASNMLEDVKKSSQKMDQTVSNCLNEFTGYLDNQGDVLKNELQSHFDNMETFLSSQSDNISNLLQENTEFMEKSTENIVKPTGSTPEKKPFQALSDAKYTRDHIIIKEEVRGSKRSFDSTTQDDENNTDENNIDGNNQDGNFHSPKKSLRETFSGNSIHSFKSSSESDVQDENIEESENENYSNVIVENNTIEQVTKTTGLPRLTRARSGKVGKSTR